MVVFALLAVPVVLAVPAQAQTVSFSFSASDSFIPRHEDQTDQEGVRRFLASFDLAANGFADLIGTTCTLNVHAANGESIHPNNFGVIVTGNSESDVLDTESEANVDETRLEDPTLVLGPTIELYNVMMPDADGIVATSVDYTVTVTCGQQVTTTTATPPTTSPTTAPPTTAPPTTAPPTTAPPTVPVAVARCIGAVPYLAIESSGWPANATGIQLHVFDRDMNEIGVLTVNADAQGTVTLQSLWPGYDGSTNPPTFPPDEFRPIYIQLTLNPETAVIEVPYPPASTLCHAAAQTTVTTIPVVTTVPPTLPNTGPGTGGWVSLAATLLVAGAVALGAARRRSDDAAPDKPFSSGR
jgi:LPXTG-motif cell wall-anchored protein